MENTRSKQTRKKLAKRLKVSQGFHSSNIASRVDDQDGAAGDPAGPASAGAAGRRPFRDLRPERPLSPGDQPEQPAQEPAAAQDAGGHHPQREADAAGGGRRALRQRPPRPRRDRRRQPPAQVALRHAQGQGRAFPPEPARQAGRLLGPFGHRDRSGAQAQPVRPAEEDGARPSSSRSSSAASRNWATATRCARPRR